MIEISHRYITSPAQTPTDDGLGFCNGENVWVHDCYIDLQGNPISELDEAIGLTYGAQGLVEKCVIRGASKNILIGSGDKEAVPLEIGKHITIRECIIEQGGRRFPEVQDGYVVFLQKCLIQDWGMKSRFKDRSFGAWAHNGGKLHAMSCVFRQQSLRRGILWWLKDITAHIWQALIDDGLKVLFQRKTYLPGTCRALTCDNTGRVSAVDCWKSHPQMLIENCESYMSDDDADALIEELEQMRAKLKTKLGIK